MWSIRFWKSTAERAIRTGAQVALGAMGTTVVGITSLDWAQIGALTATGAVASVLTSLVASGVGDEGTPSFVKGDE